MIGPMMSRHLGEDDARRLPPLGGVTPPPNSFSVFTVLPACRPNPCQNGGVCSRHRRRSRFSCACPDQYKGRFCEIGMGLHYYCIFKESRTSETSGAFSVQVTPTHMARSFPSSTPPQSSNPRAHSPSSPCQGSEGLKCGVANQPSTQTTPGPLPTSPNGFVSTHLLKLEGFIF